MPSKVYGIISGPVSVFDERDRIDEQAIRQQIDFLIGGGVHLLLAGTIVAEFPSLSFDERKLLVDIIVDQVRRRVPVYAATGGSDYRQALELIKHAEDAGADGMFLIPPYLYSLTNAEMFDYTKALCLATKLPVMLYNIASNNITPAMYKQLSEEAGNIDSIKESNQGQLADVAKAVGDHIAVLTGKEPYLVETLSVGGHGCASVLSALTPKLVVEVYDAFRRGDTGQAAALQAKLTPIANFILSGGISAPLKAGLTILAMNVGHVRKPRLPLSEAQVRVLESMLLDLEVIGPKQAAVTS